MYCRNCGKDLNEEERYCPHCGGEVVLSKEIPVVVPPLPVDVPNYESSWKKNLQAGCIAFLFVFIGIPSCLGGGCLLSLIPNSNPIPTVLMGLGLICVFAVLLYILIKMNRVK